MTALRILGAGPGVTIQDGGRRGYLRFGVSTAGPMDPSAFAIANLAVGAPHDAAAIEVSLGGVELTVEGAALSVAVAGGEFRCSLDGREFPSPALVRLEHAAMLSIRAGSGGAWCYVAPAGSIAIPAMLGSRSTHARSGIGGLDGRALAAGDRLQIADPMVLEPPLGAIVAPWLDRPGNLIRVILGPQDDYFDEDQIAAFLAGPWNISSRSDRMAYALEGETRLRHAKGFNIVSDGIAMGAIQVPGEGKPVVLMADRQPTGGYPKIANVIGADLGRLAQLRAGESLRFSAVPIWEAVAARAAGEAELARPIRIEPLARTDFDSEALLGMNLVGGVMSGEDDPSVPTATKAP